ncbi:hypothetical protein GS421_11870 [Rhodococcus hoagii]|nr:hypothetical protein [Prescottella equi]
MTPTSEGQLYARRGLLSPVATAVAGSTGTATVTVAAKPVGNIARPRRSRTSSERRSVRRRHLSAQVTPGNAGGTVDVQGR